MIICLIIVGIVVLFLLFKGPNKRGLWERERLYHGVQEFIDWQITLSLNIIALREYDDHDGENDESQRFLARSTKQVLNDIKNHTLHSDYISYFIAGAALKGAYILGGPSDMGARILASVVIEKILDIKVAQSICDTQCGLESPHSQAIMEGFASFTSFYEWKKTEVQNEFFSAGRIVDHFLEAHQEYFTRVLSNNKLCDNGV
ncbi:MAG: hypothetical protein ACRC0M_03560 [Legionella sp.]